MQIDLNADVGESFGLWTLGDDRPLLELVTSANIACGFHAGDPLTIDKTVRMAVERDVAVGAHPSYPDLSGFGRRTMNVSEEEIEADVLYQISALAGIARANGTDLCHVKPHGALYNNAARDARLAGAIARAVARFDKKLVLVGFPGGALLAAGKHAGLVTAAEGFCDRAYEADGSLRARDKRGAVFTDPEQAAHQALELARAGLVQTLCIHGDTPGAATMAFAVREALHNAGIQIAPLAEVVGAKA